MDKLHPWPLAVKKVVLFASPEYSCWQCERRLPPEPCAVAVEGLTPYGLTDSIYLTCSQDCQRALKPELAWTGRTARSMQPVETSAILRAKENVIGCVEGWQGRDRPYYLVWGPLFDHAQAGWEKLTSNAN
jgi:hypothetical protein